jgi:hypothetical protein
MQHCQHPHTALNQHEQQAALANRLVIRLPTDILPACAIAGLDSRAVAVGTSSPHSVTAALPSALLSATPVGIGSAYSSQPVDVAQNKGKGETLATSFSSAWH